MPGSCVDAHQDEGVTNNSVKLPLSTACSTQRNSIILFLLIPLQGAKGMAPPCSTCLVCMYKALGSVPSTAKIGDKVTPDPEIPSTHAGNPGRTVLCTEANALENYNYHACCRSKLSF